MTKNIVHDTLTTSESGESESENLSSTFKWTVKKQRLLDPSEFDSPLPPSRLPSPPHLRAEASSSSSLFHWKCGGVRPTQP